MTPFSGLGTEVEWYWEATGAITLTIAAEVEGRPCSRSVEIKISSPSIADSSASTGTSVITEHPVPGRQNDRDEDRLYLSFKRGDGPGFQWTGKVVCPLRLNCKSRISTLQLLKVNRRKVRLNDAVEESKTESYVLDQEVNYGMNDGKKRDVKTISIPTGGSGKFMVHDSPATFIESRGKHVYKEVTVAEDYIMFLMYRPEGGAWVAIGEMRWSWRATARYDTPSRTWRAAPGTGAKENWGLTPDRLIAFRMPPWSANVADTLESFNLFS